MRIRYFLLLLFFVYACKQETPTDDVRTFVKPNEVLAKGIANSPSMGWMSLSSMNEATIKTNADYLANVLKPYGWNLVVLDLDWYSSTAPSGLPIINAQRFPSSANGLGLKTLSDYVHAKGLKFGVSLKKDVLGFQKKDPNYFSTLVQQLLDWGVDYVKVEGLLAPYDKTLIQALQQVTNQKIVLSIDGNVTPLKEAQHVKQFVNEWSIAPSDINNWATLKQAFSWCRPWQLHIGNSHWASLGTLNLQDDKNLPTGQAGILTKDELKTFLALSCLTRSPIMLTGSLEQIDDYTLSLLSNKEVYAVQQFAKNSEELYIAKYGIVWAAEDQKSNDRYFALFNTSEETQSMRADWAMMGWNGSHRVKDLWSGEDLGHFEGTYFGLIPPHGVGLYRVFLND